MKYVFRRRLKRLNITVSLEAAVEYLVNIRHEYGSYRLIIRF